MFEIKFKTGNAAFYNEATGEEDAYYEARECQRILIEVVKKLEYGYREGTCVDYNGNRVGEWKLR